MPTYYEALEVLPTASSQEIRKAYKRLALKYHPDKNKHRKTLQLDNEALNSRFVDINEAYNVLRNSETRAQYDLELRSPSAAAGYPNEYTTQTEFERYRKLQLMHRLFREIMSNKEQISELGESLHVFATKNGWSVSVRDTYDATADDKRASREDFEQPLHAYEREISALESSILCHSDGSDEAEEFVEPPHDPLPNGCHRQRYSNGDLNLIMDYVPEDDIVRVQNLSGWTLIDKDALVVDSCRYDFAELHHFVVRAVNAIVSPLMMAVSYGTWAATDSLNCLLRIKSLQLKLIKHLCELTGRLESSDASESIARILEQMTSEDIKNQVQQLEKHPLLAKLDSGRFGRNTSGLLSTFCVAGPPFLGYSFYWSIFAILLLGTITVKRNEGDLQSFREFVDLFDRVVTMLSQL